jgi:hypothetical protein
MFIIQTCAGKLPLSSTRPTCLVNPQLNTVTLWLRFSFALQLAIKDAFNLVLAKTRNRQVVGKLGK